MDSKRDSTWRGREFGRGDFVAPYFSRGMVAISLGINGEKEIRYLGAPPPPSRALLNQLGCKAFFLVACSFQLPAAGSVGNSYFIPLFVFIESIFGDTKTMSELD